METTMPHPTISMMPNMPAASNSSKSCSVQALSNHFAPATGALAHRAGHPQSKAPSFMPSAKTPANMAGYMHMNLPAL
jgi:hypothetical protein